MATTYTELQGQIAQRHAELERQRQEAQNAEAERVAAENAPKQAIAQAEAQLRQLERQAQELRIQELSVPYRESIENERAAMLEATAELEQCKAHIDRARQAVERSAEFRAKAEQCRAEVNAYLQPLLQEARAAAWDRRIDGVKDEMTLSRLTDGDMTVRALSARELPPAPPLADLLLAWVTTSQPGYPRQFRQGMTWALGGFLGDMHGSLTRHLRFPTF